MLPQPVLHLNYKILITLGEFRQVELFGYFAALAKLQHKTEGLNEYPLMGKGAAAYFFIQLWAQGHAVNAFFTAF